jgi:gas vesicle protein
MEVIKLISSILGIIISTVTVCGLCIRPLRKFLINKISKWSNKESQDKAIQVQNEMIQKQNETIEEVKNTVNQLVDIVSELSDRIFKNEADRLRSELFDCGNRCRRHIPLSGEEFRHIQDVFKKYSDELHCNGIGEDEYNFIKDYFNSDANQDRLNKKYDN